MTLKMIGEGTKRIAYRILTPSGQPSGKVMKICKHTPTASKREQEAMGFWKNDPIIAPHLPTFYAYDPATGTVLMPEYSRAERSEARDLETYLQITLDKPSILLRSKQIGKSPDGSIILLDLGEFLPRRKPQNEHELATGFVGDSGPSRVDGGR